jgi:hypothetical protein
MIKTFWGQIIHPGQTLEIECPDDVYTIVTGACLGELPTGRSGQSVLRAKIKKVLLDQIDPNKDSDPFQIHECIFAILIPEKMEFVRFSHLFSPLNTVELKVEGDFDVHVSGIYRPIQGDVSDDDIEEEEEEELTEQQLQQKLEKYIKPAK